MRFVSQFRGYELALRGPAVGSYTVHGEPIYTVTPLDAVFRQGGLSPWETQEALDHWGDNLAGLADGVDPRTRFSVFDSEWAAKEFNWSEDDRAYAEQRLLDMPGRLGNEYIQVEERRAPLPWPSYKTFTSPDRIVAFMREGGTDPEVVLRFERENLNREDVLEAIENAGHEDVVEHEVVVKA